MKALLKLRPRKSARNRLTSESLINVDFATEQRRMTDIKAKLTRMLASCDLVIIPRMTIRNVIIGDRIPNAIYQARQGSNGGHQELSGGGQAVAGLPWAVQRTSFRSDARDANGRRRR